VLRYLRWLNIQPLRVLVLCRSVALTLTLTRTGTRTRTRTLNRTLNLTLTLTLTRYLRWLNIQPLRVLVSCRSVAGGKGLEGFVANAPSGAIGLLNSAGALVRLALTLALARTLGSHRATRLCGRAL
jgi:hypothetical protein